VRAAIRSAVILAVGTELTTGATRDTNSGELAAELSALGVEVQYTQALPDRLERVRDAFAAALGSADLVVSTGGLGPTPDDLTREAIAAATGLEPVVDPALERWLRGLFRRRGLEMPGSNLKQAWLVPGATALRNAHGTAPGWWLEVGGRRVVVALPGPPREMWPMWQAEVRSRLAQRGVGAEMASETLRLSGLGESALAELIGEDVLRRPDPEMATYARADAVDVRVSSHGPGAAERVERAVAELLPRLAEYVFARGEETWPQVIGRLLDGRSLAVIESGTGGQVEALFGGEAWLVGGELVRRDALGDDVVAAAQRVREWAGADIGLAVRGVEGEVETRVEIGLAGAAAGHREERRAFLAGPEGRRRAALAAATSLWRWLRAEGRGTS
jgi:nicotinamide-nucleotide amidase